ncbi:MAG: hypothetical protein R6U58_03630 [Bacteroidales bacterium]
MRILRIFCFVLLIFCEKAFTQSNISLLGEELIKTNRISGITEWNHPFTGEEPTETGTISLTASYGKDGYLLEETTYNSTGKESRKVMSRYDNMGNRIEYKIFDYRNNRITFSQMADFDDQGNKLLEWGFDGIGDYRNIYHHQSDGKKAEIHYNTQGTLKEKRVFSYNKNETIIHVILPDNSTSEIIKLLYNHQDKLVKEAYYNDQNQLLRKNEYSYSHNGMKKEERRYQGEQMQYRYTYIYDENLLVRIIRTDRTGRQIITNRYTYNDKEKLTREEWYNENSDDYSSRQFSWDSRGNMISVASYYASYRYRAFFRYDYNYF